ncbi:class I SAM-dependent methyltransferase [Aestuariimicrobium soli]|uniref:class I SAM-dependent methyltransferase n=1 Tax=Aestuariimicrobium soli TaxID=2035834 RepID=UPI003EBEDDAE
MASTFATDAGSRLLLDEAGLSPGAHGHDPATRPDRLLVIDEPELAGQLSERHPVLAFCDPADRHALLPAATRTTPDDSITADLCLLRLPTSLDHLDEYAGWAHASGVRRLLAVAREKDLVRRMNDVLARWYTDVHGSRGRDKHRVLHAHGPREVPAVPPETRWPRRVRRDGLTIAAHGGTFGTTRLDPGTRLLLGQLSSIRSFGARAGRPLRVLDVGSGNGTLSSALVRALPGAHLTAVDLSWAGAAATRLTLAANDQLDRGQGSSSVVWGDGLDLLRHEEPFDLIVTNPPFHQGIAKDSTFTRDLLRLAPRRLAPEGQLWIVHNTHLPWLALLREQHPGAERVAQDRQFSVIRLVNSSADDRPPGRAREHMPRLGA